MTTLYRPVPIESAEQAEALPDGTVVLIEKPWGDTTRREVGTKDHGDWWGSDCDVNFLGADGLVGWTALVPIEAEESVQELHGIKKTVPWGELIEITYPGISETADSRDWRRHAYCTPWEEA